MSGAPGEKEKQYKKLFLDSSLVLLCRDRNESAFLLRPPTFRSDPFSHYASTLSILILIKERVAEGVKRATKNHKMGRPKRTLSEVETEILDDYIDGRKTVSSCIALLKISRSTFFRRLQEHKDGKTLTNKGANTAKEKGIGEVIYG